MADQHQQASSAVIAGSSASAHSTILLVEDDADFALTCATMLRAAGYGVVTAPDHRLALEIIESEQPLDLLLSDLVMPGRVNGLALARMARLRRPQLGLLYMTAHDIPGADREAMAPILLKPISKETLLDAVAHAIRDPGHLRPDAPG